MKKWLGLTVLVIVVLLVMKLTVRKPIPLSEPKHSYAILSLSKHVDKAAAIKIEKNLGKQEGFSSHIFSYIADGNKEFGLLDVPVGKAPEGGWPVIILNHGHVTPSQYSTLNSYKNTADYLASHGFLVLKPDYRGHDKSTGKIDQLVARHQYTVDVLNLIEAVKTVAGANPNKIFLYGHSMGGEISLMAAEVSSQIKGVVLWAPAVNDYPLDMTYFLRGHGLSPTQMQSFSFGYDILIAKYGAGQFSSLAYLNRINVPILIQQSEGDEIVPFGWGEQLNQKLMAAGKQVSFISYPRDNHNLGYHFFQALEADIKFFNSIK